MPHAREASPGDAAQLVSRLKDICPPSVLRSEYRLPDRRRVAVPPNMTHEGGGDVTYRGARSTYSAACSSGAVRGRIIWMRVPPPGCESRSSRPPSRVVTML